MSRLTDKKIRALLDHHWNSVSKGFPAHQTGAFSAHGEEIAVICLNRGVEIAKLKQRIAKMRERAKAAK